MKKKGILHRVFYLADMVSEKNIRLLREELQLLEKSLIHLQGSVEKCNEIGLKDKYSFDELESFDSLTSRFARSADIFTQKVLRTILILLRDDGLFFTDRLLKAEKAGLVISADKLLEIKDLRNDIVHQYIPEATFDMVKDVLLLSGDLLKNIQKTKSFLNERKWLT